MIAATRDSPFCERKRAVLSTSQRFTDHVSSHVRLFYFGRFILVYVYRISEVLSSWRLGTKVKHAVNNVDSVLNFVTGNIFNQKKFSQEDFTLHGPLNMLTKNTGHQKQNLTLQISRKPECMLLISVSFSVL